MTTTTTDTRIEQGKALLDRLVGKVSDPAVIVGRLCEIRGASSQKWEQFKAGARANMPALSADDIAAIVAYVEG